MGTRSILIFKDSYETVGIYRHWDGYTSGVIGDLEQFFKWNTRDDAQYCAANYIYFMKDQSRKSASRKANKEHKKYYLDTVQLGHGILSDVKNCQVVDLEYVHLIDLNDNQLKVYSYEVLHVDPDEGKSWMVAVKDDMLKLDQITIFENNKIVRTQKGNNKQLPYSSLFGVV